MLTMFEKRVFDESTEKITDRIFEDENESILFFKVLVKYLEKTTNTALDLELDKLSEDRLINFAEMKTYFAKSLQLMADVAVQPDELVPTYTTGQLAIYFGVSITTINNWIKDGRFVGVERTERNSQARISADTLWKSRLGKLYTVAQIVKEWEEEALEIDNQYEDDEVSFLVNQMALYEAKYGGDYEATLGIKESLSSEEETDAATWSYFRRKFDALSGDKPTED